jgi:hypothetical protein
MRSLINQGINNLNEDDINMPNSFRKSVINNARIRLINNKAGQQTSLNSSRLADGTGGAHHPTLLNSHYYQYLEVDPNMPHSVINNTSYTLNSERQQLTVSPSPLMVHRRLKGLGESPNTIAINVSARSALYDSTS